VWKPLSTPPKLFVIIDQWLKILKGTVAQAFQRKMKWFDEEGREIHYERWITSTLGPRRTTHHLQVMS